MVAAGRRAAASRNSNKAGSDNSSLSVALADEGEFSLGYIKVPLFSLTPNDEMPGSTTISSTTPPAIPRRARRLSSILLAPLSFLRRHPGRASGILALLVLIAAALVYLGIYIWADYHLRAARRDVERGHNTEAIRHLHAYREFRPDRAEVLLLCARVARRGGAWDEAETLLDRYSHVHGDDEAVALERLLLRASRGELEAAAPQLQARIDRNDPAEALAREALVSGLLYRFRLDEAARQISDWLAHNPDSTMALLLKAKLAEQRDQSVEALQTYRRVLEIDPEHDDARLRLTSLLLGLRQGAEALGHLEYLRSRRPSDSEVLAQLGQALALMGRTDDARSVLDECLRRYPEHAAALRERGKIARDDGDLRLSQDLLDRSVRLDPSDPIARHHYYLTLVESGEKAEADRQQAELRRMEDDTKRIEELIQIRLPSAPNDPSVPYEVAMITLRAGMHKETLRWLHQALQVDPDYAPAHEVLARIYYEFGNPVLSARHRALAHKSGASSQSKQETTANKR